MTIQQWLMVALFATTFIGLICFQRNPERVFASATLACLALSFISVDDFLNNASNAGLIALILLVLCSFALERTSFLRKASNKLINGTVHKSYIRTLMSTAIASAILNNTAVVATLISPIKNNKLINPGKLLLPISYAAILGGTLTLVGTSTNLIVNSMAIEQGMSGFNFFDFTLVGGAALLCCMIVLLFYYPKLPNMGSATETSKEYFVEAEVSLQSSLIGKSIEDNGLRNLASLFLVEIVRQGHLITPIAPDDRIEAGDKLIFTGDIDKVLILQQFDGLKLFADQDGLLQDNLTEVLVKPDSSIVGKSLKSAGFRARFDAAVVAIRREGCALSGKLGDIKIQSGDFLVLAVGNDFATRTNLSKNFYILSGMQPQNMLRGWRDKSVLIGFLLTISVTLLLQVPLLTGLIFYVAFLIFSGSLTVNEIKRRFPVEIWLIVVSALSLANALENTGIADLISVNVDYFLDGKATILAFISIFILTLIITELMTNSAAAALLFPIAYNIAIGLGVSPIPFVLAVAFAASGSFISPYGYQTNVMVYNAGQYQFSDFVKFGIPVSLVYSAVVILMIPLIFPF